MIWLQRIIAFFALIPALASAAPRINEFMADNDSSLADEDGDFSDWIEIHNPDGTPFDLSGCYLTDDSGLLSQWQFPSNTQIAAGGFLVVFASDKNRAAAGSEFHTNFKLSSNEGSYIALVAGTHQ